MLGSIFQAYKNRGVPAQGAYALPVYAAGQAALGIVPAMERTYDQRYDQAYGDYEKAVLGQYTPPIADESQMFGKQDVVPLLIGDLVSRLSGGNGVVEQFMQGRSGLLAQRRQNKLEEQQAKMQQAALNAEVHRMRLNKAGQDRELFEGKVSRGQTLAYNRAKLLAQQRQQDFENQIKLAEAGLRQEDRAFARANTINDNLAKRADRFALNVNTLWQNQGQLTPELIADLERQRSQLIAEGVSPSDLPPIPGGKTRALMNDERQDKQFRQELERKKEKDRVDKEQWEKTHKLRLTEAQKNPGDKKAQQKIFASLDTRIDKIKQEYAGLQLKLEDAADDQQIQEVETAMNQYIGEYRYLARQKAIRASGRLTPAQEQYFRTILPDMSHEGGFGGAATAIQQGVGTLKGPVGSPPVTPSPQGKVSKTQMKATPPAKGKVRQVSGNTFIYGG